MFEILKQLSVILYALLGITASNVGAPLGVATSTEPSLYDNDLAIIKSDINLNNFVNLTMSNLAILENLYYVKNGKYLQRFKDKELPVYANLPQTEVYEYVGPRGDGYQAFFRLTKNGRLFERSAGVGAEAADRNFPWR